MPKPSTEWIIQADYDMDTAEYLFQGGRYIYAVFMCHLAIEKALKGLYSKKLQKDPPKSHNLMYFISKAGLMLPEEIQEFLFDINQASIPTRYPENLSKISKEYTSGRVTEIIINSREVLAWVKTKFQK